jgi:hypothetical protein
MNHALKSDGLSAFLRLKGQTREFTQIMKTHLTTLMSAAFCLAGSVCPATAGISYVESTTLSTGWYAVNLSNGGHHLAELAYTLSPSATSGPATGMPYTDINWTGIGSVNHGITGNIKGMYLGDDGKFVQVTFRTGISTTFNGYRTSSNVGNILFTNINWVGTVIFDIFFETPYGAYQSSGNGAFRFVNLESGSTIVLTASQTASGTSFKDIQWLGVAGLGKDNGIGWTPSAGDANVYFGVYQNSSGGYTTVDLQNGAETVYTASTLNGSFWGDLEGTSLADLPFVDVSGAFSNPISQTPLGLVYVVNVPEPSSSLMGAAGLGLALVGFRRRK